MHGGREKLSEIEWKWEKRGKNNCCSQHCQNYYFSKFFHSIPDKASIKSWSGAFSFNFSLLKRQQKSTYSQWNSLMRRLHQKISLWIIIILSIFCRDRKQTRLLEKYDERLNVCIICIYITMHTVSVYMEEQVWYMCRTKKNNSLAHVFVLHVAQH